MPFAPCAFGTLVVGSVVACLTFNFYEDDFRQIAEGD